MSQIHYSKSVIVLLDGDTWTVRITENDSFSDHPFRAEEFAHSFAAGHADRLGVGVTVSENSDRLRATV